MKPMDILLKKQEIDAGIYMPVAMRTVLLAVVLIALYLAAGTSWLLPDVQPTLAPFFLPAAAAVIAWYLGTLVPIIFIGQMVTAVQDAFVALAITLFLALSLNAFLDFSSYAPPVALVGGALIVYILCTAYSSTGYVFARAAFLAVAGLCILLLSEVYGQPDVVALGWMALVGCEVAAALSLSGLVSGHTNEYVAYIGRTLGGTGSVLLVGIACSGLLAYDRYVRPDLAAQYGINLMVAEWLVVLVVLALVGYRIWSFAKQVSYDRQYGDLSTLIQRISYDKKHIETAASAVNGFVEAGRKEALIVYLTKIMLDNGAPSQNIEVIISGIVGYCDEPEPQIALRWTRGDIARRNRERRLAVVNDAVTAGAAFVNPKHAEDRSLPTDAAAPREENVLIIT